MKTKIRRLKNFQQLGTAQSRSVTIDQGMDKGGEDVGFRPTELWLIALSSCSATTMTRYANEQGYSLTELEVNAEDTVNEDGYIESVTFHVTMEGDLTKEQKEDLIKYVRANCKLLLTVNPSIQLNYVESSQSLENSAVVCTLEDGNCCV
jgi:putative redox protein